MTDPMTPFPFRVQQARREVSDVVTLDLVPAQGPKGFSFRPGQFNMLYAFGMGEVPISISGDPGNPSKLVHTIRRVGSVSNALCVLRKGETVGVRGPFGSAWPMEEMEGADVVIVTGGIGLAPLRPAIYRLLADRERFGTIDILYGARTPADILFRKELEHWRGRFDLRVAVTVDRGARDWGGKVGLVTNLLEHGGFSPPDTVALVCGPEIMMRHAVDMLEDRGVGRRNIYVSMERNMKCGIGFCGHCQLGGDFVCKDGPVFRYDAIADRFRIREF